LFLENCGSNATFNREKEKDMTNPGATPIEKSVIRKVSLSLINTIGNVAGFVAPEITGDRGGRRLNLAQAETQ
jgi:hypothetical protein